MARIPLRYPRTVAVLTTLHGKDRVIKPVLERELGLVVGLAFGVDTDQFGTFSREVERSGTQLDAARAKVQAGFAYAPLARVGLASEGSFGPHPMIPFVAVARELVLLVDRDRGLELRGHDVSNETNFAHTIVRTTEEAVRFARRIGFPSHGVTVSPLRDDRPAPDLGVAKDVESEADLALVVAQVVEVHGAAFIESDMRAHRNPTRMAAIERAARDLVRTFKSRCPCCAWRGFGVKDRLSGLPCADCGTATLELRAEIKRCDHCSRTEEHKLCDRGGGDPTWRPRCNP